jgi:putative intracellular protease/amidase
LAKAGVLKNIHATWWDGDGELQDVFDKYGVVRVDEPVVVDGVVVTENGPLSARDFGKKIIEVLHKN